MNKVRQKDIAEKTGLSVSTVSRILSGDITRKMKDETVDLVLRTADEMGYYSFKKQKLQSSIPTVKMISLFVSDHEVMNDFFSGILEGINREITETKKHMRIDYEAISIYDVDFKQKLESRNVDVAILLGRVRRDLLEVIRQSVPYIIYAGLNSIPGFDEVLCDAREGIREGVSHLYEQGHRRIAYIGPNCLQSEVRNEFRYMGYLEGLADKGIPIDEDLTENTYLSTADGYQAALKLLGRTTPDAIVAANDNVAIGVLRALKEKGFRCPDDIALLGFDNIETGAYTSPSLSTFDVPKQELGRFAVKFAIDRIENPRDNNIRITLPYVFVERESTGGKRK